MPAQRIEDTDPLDGPTKEFLRHHDVVLRSGDASGKRIRTTIENSFASGTISPAQAAAAKRFTDDYLKGCIARGRSCIDVQVRGGGGFHSEERHAAAFRFERARVESLHFLCAIKEKAAVLSKHRGDHR